MSPNLFKTSSCEQLLANLSRSMFSLQAPVNRSIILENVASIRFVSKIIRFDTVHTLVNRYGMPDFAVIRGLQEIPNYEVLKSEFISFSYYEAHSEGL